MNALHVQPAHRVPRAGVLGGGIAKASGKASADLAGPVARALKQAGLLTPPSSPQLRRHSRSRSSSLSPVKVAKRQVAKKSWEKPAAEHSDLLCPFVSKLGLYEDRDAPRTISTGIFDTCSTDSDASYDWNWLSSQTGTCLDGLLGTWEDPMGSTYCVTADGGNEFSCSVKTIRSNGATRVTRGLIKANPKGKRKAAAQVTWGDGFILKTMDARPDELCWIAKTCRGSGKSFQWRRIAGTNAMYVNTELDEPWCEPETSHRTIIKVPCSAKILQKALNGAHARTRAQYSPDYCFPVCTQDEASLSWRDANLRAREDIVLEASLRVREAAVVLREVSADVTQARYQPHEFGADELSRKKLSAEVAVLVKKRNSEKVKLQECRKEQEKMKEKLQRCREVVAITVDSVDRMFTEYEADMVLGGAGPSDEAGARFQAEAADAEAKELLKGLDDETASTSDGADSTSSSSGPRSCFDVSLPSRNGGKGKAKGKASTAFLACKEETVEAPDAAERTKILRGKVFGVSGSASEAEDFGEPSQWQEFDDAAYWADEAQPEWDEEEPEHWNTQPWGY